MSRNCSNLGTDWHALWDFMASCSSEIAEGAGNG
jgi:hypothetical protein